MAPPVSGPPGEPVASTATPSGAFPLAAGYSDDRLIALMVWFYDIAPAVATEGEQTGSREP